MLWEEVSDEQAIEAETHFGFAANSCISLIALLCGDNDLIKCLLIFLWTFSLTSPFLPALKKDAKNVTHTTDGSPTSGLFILKAGVRMGRKVKQDVAGFSYKGGE